MPETSSSEVVDPSTLVTVAAFNDWKASTDAQMKELKEMMQSLMQRTLAPLPPSETPGVTQEDKSKDKPSEDDLEGEKGDKEDPNKNKPPNASKGEGGEGDYSRVPFTYPVDPPIPHPHVNIRGDPPKLDTTMFANWQFLMTSHMNSACIELWRIVQEGFYVHNPSNLTRREVVDKQLNATALHMIHVAVGEKHLAHIQHLSTAKEAWDTLTDTFIGNESMRRNRFEALSNQAEGFFMQEGEDHEDMYRSLKTIATTFKHLGA